MPLPGTSGGELGTHLQKIRNHLLTGAGQHAFGVKLDALNGELPVTQAHDDAGAIAVAHPGAHFQVAR